jgi:hypothetical protein
LRPIHPKTSIAINYVVQIVANFNGLLDGGFRHRGMGRVVRVTRDSNARPATDDVSRGQYFAKAQADHLE